MTPNGSVTATEASNRNRLTGRRRRYTWERECIQWQRWARFDHYHVERLRRRGVTGKQLADAMHDAALSSNAARSLYQLIDIERVAAASARMTTTVGAPTTNTLPKRKSTRRKRTTTADSPR